MANILLITHISPPAVDGGSRVIVKMGEYLKKLGHQTLLISSNCYSTDDFVRSTNKNTPGGLPVFTIFHKPFKLISKIFPIFGVFAKGPIFKFVPFFQLLVTSYQFHPDLIIAGPLPTTIVLYARFLKFVIRNCKLLINASFHPTDPDFHNSLLINTLKTANYVWTLTDHETKLFNNSIKLGNGIDPSLLKTSPKNFPKIPTLLYIGTLAKHKNIESLVNEHQKLLLKFPNLRLIIAGQKSLYYPQLKKLLKLPNIKTIFGFSDKQLKTIIDSSTIVVSPSTQESFGLTIIEAWARKTPVIGQNIPATSELISNSLGGLIGLNNIEMLLRDQTLCQKLGQNGYNYVKANYLWPDIAKKLCQNTL
ncbi:MAG: glycosyltransferase family 4 protein [Candidatus Shapirobacteria bacterium]